MQQYILLIFEYVFCDINPCMHVSGELMMCCSSSGYLGAVDILSQQVNFII